MKPYIAQTASNLRLMGRDPAVLFFSALFPMVFFFVFAQAFHAGSSSGAMAQVIASVMIIGVLGNGFFGAGIRTVVDRETNVLRRFKVAPINAGPIIVASMISGLGGIHANILPLFAFWRIPVRRTVSAQFAFACLLHFHRPVSFSCHGNDHCRCGEFSAGSNNPDPVTLSADAVS